MNRIYFLLLPLAIFLCFFSCQVENEPLDTRSNSFSPKITAVTPSTPTTKAGVKEDNADYAAGEKFYWSMDDKSSVFFDAEKLDYTVASIGTSPNQAEFTTAGSLSQGAGVYDIYGYFPASAWDLNALSVEMPADQRQGDATSTHLSSCMFMQAQKKAESITEAGTLTLDYKHLASVLRIVVWNATGLANLTLNQVTLKTASGTPAFGTKATLADKTATAFTVDVATKSNQVSLQLAEGAFVSNGTEKVCNGYMAVLPTGAFDENDALMVDMVLADGEKQYTVSKSLNFNQPSQAGFMKEGIVQGKSYYFKLKIEASELRTAVSYQIGDYYPDPTNASTAQGMVFWIKPGSGGAHGKVLGMKEVLLKMGTKTGYYYTNEYAAGIVGVRNSDDGYTATRNMIKRRIIEEKKTADYPAYDYIYTTMNGGNVDGPWYIPAFYELRALYAGINGNVYESISGWKHEHGPMPGYDGVAAEMFRTNFNKKIKTASGTELSFIKGSDTDSDKGSNYWTSTERDTFYEFVIRFDTGLGFNHLKDYVFRVRPIKEF